MYVSVMYVVWIWDKYACVGGVCELCVIGWLQCI